MEQQWLHKSEKSSSVFYTTGASMVSTDEYYEQQWASNNWKTAVVFTTRAAVVFHYMERAVVFTELEASGFHNWKKSVQRRAVVSTLEQQWFSKQLGRVRERIERKQWVYNGGKQCLTTGAAVVSITGSSSGFTTGAADSSGFNNWRQQQWVNKEREIFPQLGSAVDFYNWSRAFLDRIVYIESKTPGFQNWKASVDTLQLEQQWFQKWSNSGLSTNEHSCGFLQHLARTLVGCKKWSSSGF
eukprot:gene14046-5027_t